MDDASAIETLREAIAKLKAATQAGIRADIANATEALAKILAGENHRREIDSQ